jgi:hypothetical protein
MRRRIHVGCDMHAHTHTHTHKVAHWVTSQCKHTSILTSMQEQEQSNPRVHDTLLRMMKTMTTVTMDYECDDNDDGDDDDERTSGWGQQGRVPGRRDHPLSGA